jgi:hypothetical protein
MDIKERKYVMAMQQGTLAQERTDRFVTHLGAHVAGIAFSVAVKAPVRFAVRALVGSQSGPRGYTREKFPEAQWQQILAGRRNWFS